MTDTTNPQQPEPWWAADGRLKPHALPAATTPDGPSLTGGFDDSVEIPDLPAVSVPASAPTGWIDGHPQLEAIAAAVWERCGRSDSGTCVEDDPRNIAVAALAAVLPARAARPACDCEAEVHMGAGFYHQPQCVTRNSQPTDRAAILREAADVAESQRQFKPATGARWSAQVSENVGILRVAEELRRLADVVPVSGPGGAGGDEGDELTCVDMCGSCDACGMEPFGTPAEGWRQAARFLRRTARDSGNRAGSLHAASLIETELRARAEAAGPDGAADEAQPEPESGCAHCGGPHAWDDCETYTALVASEQQPEPRADTALRIRVLSEILGRLTGRQDGDSATDDVPAATVRRVLAEILVGMQRGIGRGGDTEQPAAVAQPDGEA
jgi:hypothetical protein